MARRRKHATALFEVYRHTTSSNGSSRSGWGFPWKKSKSDDSDFPTAAPIDYGSDNEPDPTMTRVAPVVMHDPDGPSEPGRPGLRVSLDSSDQTINVALSYGSAAVVCFAIMVMVGLAYVFGRHSGRGPLPLLAERTTDEVRHDKPRADVLDIRPMVANNTITPAIKAAEKQKPSAKPQTWNDPHPPATLVSNDDDKPRVVGLNYLIIRSYPEEKDAQAAVAVLKKYGIKATIEDPPAGFNNPNVKMHSVIGKTGFDRMHNSPEFEKYIDTIMKASDEFAGNSKYKRFAPTPFKWREAKKE